LADKEIPLDFKVSFFGDRNSENIIISWGSPKGAIIEALDILKNEGINAGFLQVRLIHPLPATHIKELIKGKKRIIAVESNFTAQLSGVIAEQTGISPNFYILKYTGRPMMTDEVYEAVKAIITGKAAERQVLMHGS
jgi:2-oxoglutarate ferredoxin oxidoreductase subunit alpha